MAAAGNWVQKKISKPPYVESWAWKNHLNVELVACNGTKYLFNSCVLAAISPLCWHMLESADSSAEGYFSIMTELASDELLTFQTFVTSGSIFNYNTTSDLLEDKSIASIFEHFGICLELLSFRNCEVQGVKDEQIGTPMIVPFCAVDPWTHRREPHFKHESDYDSSGGSSEPAAKRKRFEDKKSDVKSKEQSDIADKIKEEPDWDSIPPDQEEMAACDLDWEEEGENKPLKNQSTRAELFYFPQKMTPKYEKEKRERKYHCHLCVRSFPTSTKLQQHVRRHSAKSNKDIMFCLTCPDYVAFPNKQKLKEHNTKLHSSKKEFKCIYCPKIVDNVQKLKDGREVCIDRHGMYKLRQHVNYAHPHMSDMPPSTSHLFYFPQKMTAKHESERKNRPFHCHLCVRSFTTNPVLQQHIRRHSAKSQQDIMFCLKCPDYVAFPDKQGLDDHDSELHAVKKELKCPHCPMIVDNIIRFKNGREGISDKMGQRKLKSHIKVAHRDKVEKVDKVEVPQATFTCFSCGKGYANKTSLRNHLKYSGPFHDGKCRLCEDFEAKSWEENLQHCENEHQGQIQYKCGKCPAHFLSEVQQKGHIMTKCEVRIKNRQNEKEICPVCAKSFSPNTINRHIEEAHGTHSIPCEYEGCDVIMKHPNAIKKHVRLFHTEVTCHLCGKSYRNKDTYNSHMRSVHTANDMKAFICKTCGKGCDTKKSYEDHLNVHTGEKPHKCSECNACFASKGTLNGHVKQIHLGIKRKFK